MQSAVIVKGRPCKSSLYNYILYSAEEQIKLCFLTFEQYERSNRVELSAVNWGERRSMQYL